VAVADSPETDPPALPCWFADRDDPLLTVKLMDTKAAANVAVAEVCATTVQIPLADVVTIPVVASTVHTLEGEEVV